MKDLSKVTTNEQLEGLLIAMLKERRIGMPGNPVRSPKRWVLVRAMPASLRMAGFNARIVFYTHRFEVHISAAIYRSRRGLRTSYMCGGIAERRAYPGEGWHRGNDIHDGLLNDDTLDQILFDALQQELAVPPEPHERFLEFAKARGRPKSRGGRILSRRRRR